MAARARRLPVAGHWLEAARARVLVDGDLRPVAPAGDGAARRSRGGPGGWGAAELGRR